MRVIVFCHSLRSDWNHGNAHFLRGIVTDMLWRGFDVRVYEPEDAWSVQNLVKDRGPAALDDYRRAYPLLSSQTYRLETLDLTTVLEGADVVIVHEWNDPELVAAIGEHRALIERRRPRSSGGWLRWIKRGAARRIPPPRMPTPGAKPYALLFHDTHHRAVTAPEEMARFDLSEYNGVLAFGNVIRDLYVKNGWARRAWTWHEAADPRVFHPLPNTRKTGDLVWVGNWGDNERTKELHEFLLRPVKQLGLRATVYGVRYPKKALQALEEAGIAYGGYLPNHRAPEVFARHRVTVHVPRGPYVRALPGIPTIRPFEALACGIPLVSAPWSDREGLFHGEDDYLTAWDGQDMTHLLQQVLTHPDLAAERAAHGRKSVLSRHTCAHRVDELLGILEELKSAP